MNQLKDFKTLIDEEVDDAVLQLYINDAENFILNHCNLDEIPNRLYSALLNIAVFKFRLRGYEGVKRESMGAVNETFHETIPAYIIKELDDYNNNNQTVKLL
ncbi:head-tail connector protein [Bacillus sp. NMCN1]|uniref:head-tail connector protein n=1 Tax=Bacillus sp. NMCN1 TaxID=2108536 RepID=UPI000D030293|nr:head-tail connector protein [Bacillus sp. NMCN1]PRR92861.1 hypothetical protein C6W21_05570 [Bacillus sp. NMCN1]